MEIDRRVELNLLKVKYGTILLLIRRSSDRGAESSGYDAENPERREKRFENRETGPVNLDARHTLLLSGDLRCFRLVETPLENFVRDVLQNVRLLSILHFDSFAENVILGEEKEDLSPREADPYDTTCRSILGSNCRNYSLALRCHSPPF